LRTLKVITDDAIKEGFRSINELYFYGWHFGYTFTYELAKAFELKKFEERYKVIMDIAELIGFGAYETLHFKQGHHSKFKNIKNPFALLYYPSNQLVCHFVRGMNAGGGTIVHEKLMQGIEVDCCAKNNEFCLFYNVSEQALKELDQNLVKQQLDLKWLKKKQVELIKNLGHDPKKYLSD
jgi:predicted hydrocarbon binding protein